MDDIAKRHPEFAEHLKFGEGGGFPPFRSNLRERWGAEGDPSGSQDPFEEYRRFERPFGDRFPFTNRGFPEEGAEFGPSHFQQPPPQQQQQQQQPPPEAAQQQQEQPRQQETPRQAPVHERKLTNPNLIQSNTVDLGQKQEPVDEKRNQRSMSAPPENRNPQQRFVSTCNIPVNADATPGEAQQQEQPKPSQQNQNRTNERVIPIHVEGRDVPVVPKNVHQTFTPPPPQPERVFGNKPTFPQYFNRDNIDRPFGSPAEEMFRQPYFRGHSQQQQRPQSPTTFQKQPQQTPPPQQPQQQQKPTPPPQQQKPAPPPQQQQQQPPPQQQQQPKTAIDHIQAIQKDVLALMDDVEKFTGKYRDKQYLYLDEMLTRNLLKLDNIDTEGKDNIRTARKEAIKCIEKCISLLEAKAAANSPELQQQRAAEENMEVEPATSDEKPPETEQAMEAEPIKALEVSGVARSGTQANVPENPEVPKEEAAALTTSETAQQMEVVEEKKPETEVKQQEAIPLPPPPEHKEAVNPETEQNEEKPKDKKKGKKKDKVEKK